MPSSRRLPIAVAVLLLLATGSPSPAAAHPHVWIDAVTTFVVKAGMVTGIRVEWTFDEFFSTTLLDDFDVNRDKRFDAKEIAALEKDAFGRTAAQGYFTFVKVDGAALKGLAAKEFTARVDKGIVHYSYLLPFPHPVDPRKAALTVTYYEDSYYIDVAPAEHGPVRFDGDGSLTCTGTVAEDPKTTIYFNSVHPLTVTLHC